MSELVMTPGELAVWRYSYSVAFHGTTPSGMGAVSDEDRAIWAAMQATRAVLALRTVCLPGAEEARR